MNSKYFFEDYETIPEALLGVAVIYILIILFTRLYGLRSFSKMTSFDFAMTIAIGSLIASTVSTGKPTVAMGAVIIGFLYFAKYLINLLVYISPQLAGAINNRPILLILDGELLHHNLKLTKVTEDEIREKLRESNVWSLQQVKAVVLETTGDVSVIHGDQNVELDEYILKGVRQ